MKRIAIAALAAALLAGVTPALAKEDCDGGYKNFLGKMSIYVDKMSGYELADAVRKSLDAYNSCSCRRQLLAARRLGRHPGRHGGQDEGLILQAYFTSGPLGATPRGAPFERLLARAPVRCH